MRITEKLKEMREIVQGNWQSLSKPYHRNRHGYEVSRIELSSRIINGGLDDRDENRKIFITEEGWDVFRYEEETNMRAGWGGARITRADHHILDDVSFEEYLNGDQISFDEVRQIFNAYDRVKRMKK